MRRRHLKAATGLSPAARALIDAAFADGRPSYADIAQQIQTQTGERIGQSSVARYWREWSARQRAHEAQDQARALIAEFKDRPSAEIEQALEALATATIYQGIAGAEGDDLSPAEALVAQDRLARRKLKALALEIEGKRVELVERKLAALETKLRQADTQVEALAQRRNLDAETLAEIKGIYGLGD